MKLQKKNIMRKNLIILAAMMLFSLVAAAQNVETLDVSKEADGPYSRRVGKYLVEGNVQNGLKEGVWYEMDADKRMIHRMIQFEKGKKNGVCIEVDETGALIKKTEYADDLLNGSTYNWYRGGRLAGKASYKRGVLDGEQINCYEQGNTSEIANYKDGLRDGITTWYDQSGNRVMSIEYKEGKFEGVQETYYKTGGIKTSKMFSNNVQDGLSVEYYEGGAVKSECTYKKGKAGKVKTYEDTKPYVDEKQLEMVKKAQMEKEKQIQMEKEKIIKIEPQKKIEQKDVKVLKQ